MLKRTTLAATAAILATGATAQAVVSNSPNSAVIYAVGVPGDTASSGNGPIYFRIAANSGTQWVGLGQGSSMSGSNIFMVYADGNGNVTVSPRLGTGQRQPTYNAGTATSITLLEGSGIDVSGNLIANVRCDGCISWSGGNMDPTSSSSSWIWAIKAGSAIDSTALDESLDQHDSMGNINFDLTQAQIGSSTNPFIAASNGGSSSSSSAAGTSTTAGSASSTDGSGSSSTTGSASTSTSTATATSGLLLPSSSGSSSPSSGSSSSSSGGSNDGARRTHATIMSLLFLIFFPMFALTLYLPFAKRVPFVHAPLQVVSIILLIVGLAAGISLGKSVNETSGYHQVIGYIVVFCLIILQPALGIYQHIHFRRTGGRSALGAFHQWLGRIAIIFGVINGGLGFTQSGPIGSEYVPRGAVAAYSVIAVIVFIIYIAVVFLAKRREQRAGGNAGEKPQGVGYEMHSSSNQSKNHREEYARRFPGHGPRQV